MNKYFKKFGIMFVMTLILSLGFCISAFADDGGVVGTSNLNNTSQNSAVVGNVLKAPEIGWKRYEETNNKIKYNGAGWISENNTGYSSGSIKYSATTNDSLEFKFYGTKLRLIVNMYNNRTNSNHMEVFIDNVSVGKINSYSDVSNKSALAFESLNLNLGVHDVKVVDIASDGKYIVLDAIDIDSNGHLVDPNESISIDQSSMDMTEGDTQQLTATTTPAGAQVTWTSSDSSIATVDATGNVTGIKEGQVTITATTADGLTATCTVTVSPKGTEPSNPTDPTGDANLYIELVDGQIKQYTVSSDEINKFTDWYENRDNDHSLPATYKFTKGSYTDYVVQSQIDWFEVR